MNVSASSIREAISSGYEADALRLVPQSVADYIRKYSFILMSIEENSSIKEQALHPEQAVQREPTSEGSNDPVHSRNRLMTGFIARFLRS